MDDLTGLMLGLHDAESVRESILKPPFGYQGSKFRLVKQILPLLPYRTAYIEPFGGSFAVGLSRKPSKLEVFNDRYSGVVAFYRCIRDKEKAEQLKARLEVCLHAREEFIWCRDTWKNPEDEVERAARWYYSIEMSFGCQGRNFARATKSTCSQGRSFHAGLDRFMEIHRRMKNVQVENQDFRMLIKDFDSPDVVWYMDPPYFDCYPTYEKDLTKEEHTEFLERIFHMQGFVAVSGYPNWLYDDPKWPWDSRHSWEVAEMTNGFCYTETNGRVDDKLGKRERVMETIWIKEAK
jgi:DNA adenine methylase